MNDLQEKLEKTYHDLRSDLDKKHKQDKEKENLAKSASK
jgi:hypothetical protein